MAPHRAFATNEKVELKLQGRTWNDNGVNLGYTGGHDAGGDSLDMKAGVEERTEWRSRHIELHHHLRF
ncbi:hypothetical protein Bca4012_038076 [Brassica carinata]|uniref:Uncharacterized protein n=1 Tax=Brassica carinata TaxID=52824 RepID=A0A8X7W7G8_BRACI|nr:hypothetical protein Bca52824_006533 [Brassica carinata]